MRLPFTWPSIGRLFLAGISILCCCAHRQPPGIRTYEDYAGMSVNPPYVLQLNAPKGGLLYFGATHTTDGSDPQFAGMESLWVEFKPTISFSEGGDWPLETTREEAIRKHGEQGLLRFLAERDGVPLHNIEPERDEEAGFLLRLFPPEQVKLFYALRQVAQHRRMKDVRPLDEYVQEVLLGLGRVEGLDGAPSSLAELKEVYSRTVKQTIDWRNVPEEWFYPTGTEMLFNHIARNASRLRDEHMVEVLTKQLKDGERVFAVVGFAHVVMQEPALRHVLEK
jgi:hypothetical protein